MKFNSKDDLLSLGHEDLIKLFMWVNNHDRQNRKLKTLDQLTRSTHASIDRLS